MHFAKSRPLLNSCAKIYFFQRALIVLRINDINVIFATFSTTYFSRRELGAHIIKFDTFTFSTVNWQNAYYLPFLCTGETKLRVFQFKFLHRRMTNDFLCKIGIKQVVLFCGETTETLVHLFWQCKHTQAFYIAKNFFQRALIILRMNDINVIFATFSTTYFLRRELGAHIKFDKFTFSILGHRLYRNYCFKTCQVIW